MEGMFVTVLHMSLTAAVIILAVLCLRLCLRKMPKIFSYLLWVVVLFRLVCPVSFSSELSLIGWLGLPAVGTSWELQGDSYALPGGGQDAGGQALQDAGGPQTELYSAQGGGQEADGKAMTDGTDGNSALTGNPGGNAPAGGAGGKGPWMAGGPGGVSDDVNYGRTGLGAGGTGAAPEAIMARLVWRVMATVWSAGVLVMCIYSLVNLMLFAHGLRAAVIREEDGICYTSYGTPFVFGVLHTKIYLPDSLAETEREYILLHEQIHIRRGDHIVRMVSWLVLCVHWFNPLVWVAFFASTKDMEMSCDEAVIRRLGRGRVREYSNSLLALATGHQILSGAPLAFGEGDPEGRIKNLLGYKRPAIIIMAVAAVAVVAAAVCLVANPVGDGQAKPGQDGENGNIAEMTDVSGGDGGNTYHFASISADLTGDNVEESITVFMEATVASDGKQSGAQEFPGQVLTLRVYDGSAMNAGGAMNAGEEDQAGLLYTDSLSYVDGVGSIYGVTQYQGQTCMLHVWNAPVGDKGEYSFGYEIFALDAKGEKLGRETDEVTYRIRLSEEELPQYAQARVPDLDALIPVYALGQLEEKVTGLLAEADRLLGVMGQEKDVDVLGQAGTEITWTGFDVFAGAFIPWDGQEGDGEPASIKDFADIWRQSMYRTWMEEKLALDAQYAQCHDILAQVYDDYREIMRLYMGIGATDTRGMIGADPDGDGVRDSYLPVVEEAYPDLEAVKNQIAKTATGDAAAQFTRDLIDNHFYIEESGSLYQLEADFVGFAAWDNIIDYERVSDRELYLRLDGGIYSGELPSGVEMTLVWEGEDAPAFDDARQDARGSWKIAALHEYSETRAMLMMRDGKLYMNEVEWVWESDTERLAKLVAGGMLEASQLDEDGRLKSDPYVIIDPDVYWKEVTLSGDARFYFENLIWDGPNVVGYYVEPPSDATDMEKAYVSTRDAGKFMEYMNDGPDIAMWRPYLVILRWDGTVSEIRDDYVAG